MGNFSEADLKETSITNLNSDHLNLGGCRLDLVSLQLLTLRVYDDYQIEGGFLHDVQFILDSEFYSMSVINSSINQMRIDSFSDFGHLPVLDLSGSFVSNSSFNCSRIDTFILDSIHLDWETNLDFFDPGKKTVFLLDGSLIEIDMNQSNNLLEYLKGTGQVDSDSSFYEYSFWPSSEVDSIETVYFKKKGKRRT